MLNDSSFLYHLVIYGCQMNKSDAERLAAVMESLNFKKTDKEEQAEVIIVVACSVRQRAIDRVYAKIKKIKSEQFRVLGQKSPLTILTGCVLEPDRKKLAKLFDLVIKIEEIKKLPQFIASWFHCFIDREIREANCKNTLTLSISPPCKEGINNGQMWFRDAISQNNTEIMKQWSHKKNYFLIPPKHSSKISAYVPIMTGCNNFCAYCVVPYTRGPEISRSPDEIFDEIKFLIKQGYKEIILLGQNVNTYYFNILTSQHINIKTLKHENIKTLKHKNKGVKQFTNEMTRDFARLLCLINNLPGDFWLRFITSNPWGFSDEMIEAMAEGKKICKYLHLPVQSGSNEILKKMNRRYSREQYIKLIQKIRKKIPQIAISTDIIVGFPGETKKQFSETASLMKKIKFDLAYIAEYSPRPGTLAAKCYIDDVSLLEKKQRKKILENILKSSALENNQRYVGKVIRVLVLQTLKHFNILTLKHFNIKALKQNYYLGKTETFKNVKFESVNKNLLGKFVTVKITQADSYGLRGNQNLQ